MGYTVLTMKKEILSHLETTENKTANVVARVTPDDREAFKQACQKLYKKDYSKVLRAFIKSTIEKAKK